MTVPLRCDLDRLLGLTRDELGDALATGWGPPLQATAAARRGERERARATVPAPFLGTPPPAHADVAPMVAKFYGVPGSAAATAT